MNAKPLPPGANAMRIIPVVLIFAVIAMSGAAVPEEAPPPEETASEAVDVRSTWDESHYRRLADINALATTAQLICPSGTSDECLTAVMCLIYNRSLAAGFPDSIEGVCNQKGQWQKQNDSEVVSAHIKRLAAEKYDEWTSGEICVLPIPSNCVFLSTGNNGFWFRSKWEGENEAYVPYVC